MKQLVYAHALGAQLSVRKDLEAARVDPPLECGTLAELFCWQRQQSAKEVVVALRPPELELVARAAGPLRVITPFGNLIIDYGEDSDARD